MRGYWTKGAKGGNKRFCGFLAGRGLSRVNLLQAQSRGGAQQWSAYAAQEGNDVQMGQRKPACKRDEILRDCNQSASVPSESQEVD
jgi:hypothetical protein